jgi:hypothetical protein
LEDGSSRIIEKIPSSRNPNQNTAAPWLIFSSKKSAPANRKKGFYTNPVSKKQGIRGILYEIKKSKT